MPPRPTMLQTVQKNVRLNGGLERAPKKRRDKKVHDSYTGIIIMLMSLPIWGFTAYLAATQPKTSLWVLGGGGVLGTAVLVFGAIGSDKETFLPVFKEMVGSVVRVRKS